MNYNNEDRRNILHFALIGGLVGFAAFLIVALVAILGNGDQAPIVDGATLVYAIVSGATVAGFFSSARIAWQKSG